MKFLIILLLTINFIFSQENHFIKNMRQLIFEGKRSGEGYFDLSGNLLSFQSERNDDNPFFQIYLLNFKNGDITKISPGIGKSTCSWIHPNKNKVLFASTHLDSNALLKQNQELEFRKSGKSRRYSWDYDEHYELFLYDLNTKKYEQITNSVGYDAEGAVSPDGDWVVFSSNRSGYNEEMSDSDRKLFEKDKSFKMDIYKKNLNNGEIIRLTDVDGYDGGPFFSSDGKKITWRRFSKDGTTAEIYVMDSDGKNTKKITNLNAMSWAPFYHPSGEYIIFSTNIHGFDNFELYIASTSNSNTLRITDTKGFDSLPTFSPDGKKISWTTQRTSNKKSQIFIADWNHEYALKKLNENGEEKDPSISEAINENELKSHIEILSSPDFEGRMTGTLGEKKTIDYIAKEFEKLNLKKYSNNSYFEEFSFTSGIKIGNNSKLIINSKKNNKLNKNWTPLTWSSSGTFSASEIVWAGYGIQAPKKNEFEEYDSFVHLDVKDKWVMVLRYLPENISDNLRQHLARYSSLRYKAMIIRDMGAKGMIVVSGPNSKVKNELIPPSLDASNSKSSLAVISITDKLANYILSFSSRDNSLKKLQTNLDLGKQQMGFSIPINISSEIEIIKETKKGFNVIGTLTNDNIPKNKPKIIIGGHLDHLGIGKTSASLSKNENKDIIHYGADDNASGIASLIEISEWFSEKVKNNTIDLKREVVFAAWSGEELGLLGSSNHLKNIESDNNSNLSNHYASYINMDMIGRYREGLVINGIGSSSIWKKLIEQKNIIVGLNLILQDDSYLPTDATSFYLKKIPILSAFTGAHSEYHTEKDTPDLINLNKLKEISILLALISESLSTSQSEPDFLEPKKPAPDNQRTGLRVYLGTIPDYASSDIIGLKLSGVSKGGPADKAGIKSNDIIIELAGKKIENIYDYTYAIDALKIDQKTEIKINRNGKVIILSITPGSRN
ncbi:MAG: peptidase M28 [Candidatus Marinimicrobia bacterium]|nr:peptidase M28 [Candidatus Neomarinimicrobiota bacterium]OUW50143.1 MAG: hypothetical protein CBD50_04225 [bacterium TMED190]